MFRKLKGLIKSHGGRRIMAVCMAVMVLAIGAVGASADSAAVVSGVQTVTDAVTTEFSIATIASIIGVVLAGCVGLFLFWWGARKVVRMISAAFKKGKISL